MELLYALAAFVLVATLTGVVALVILGRNPLEGRLRGLGQSGGAADVSILRWDPNAPVALWRKGVEAAGRLLLGRTQAGQEARRRALRKRLAWAGFQNPEAVLALLGSKVFTAAALAYAYTLYGLLVQRVMPNVLMVSAILAVLGFFLPDFWLSQRIKARQRKIRNALPDVLDLLVVCVEAGLGLDAAIARVADPELGKRTPLHEELHQVHLQFRAGQARMDALRDLADRTGVDEIRVIVGAFIQTDRLGTSLANTLRVHADASRVKRRHRAEKQAYLAPLKMLFPMVFFLFPATLIVTVGPSMLRIMSMLGNMMR